MSYTNLFHKYLSTHDEIIKLCEEFRISYEERFL